MNFTINRFRSNQIIWIASITIAILYILPFLVIIKFTFLSYDDFCRTNSNFQEYFSKVWTWYKGHNGRYANALLARLPVYDLGVYKISLVALFLFFGSSIYGFLSGLYRFFQLNVKSNYLFLLNILSFITIIAALPSVFEFFYWYAGASTYLVGSALFLFMLRYLMNIESGGEYNLPTVGLTIFMLVGINEMFLPITNLILGLYLLRCFKEKNKFYAILILNAISWVGSLLVLFSPGTIIRRQNNPGGGDLLFSLFSSVQYTLKFIAEQFLEMPQFLFFLSLFLITVYFAKIQTRNFQFKIHPLYISVISFMLLVSVLFVPFYAEGGIGYHKKRIGDVIYVVYYTLMTLNIVSFSLFFLNKIRINEKWLKISFITILVFFLIAIPIYSYNYEKMGGDIKNNRFSTYEEKINERMSYIKNFKGNELILQKIEGTQILKHYELSNDNQFWVNQCFIQYLSDKYSTDITSVKVAD